MGAELSFFNILNIHHIVDAASTVLDAFLTEFKAAGGGAAAGAQEHGEGDEETVSLLS